MKKPFNRASIYENYGRDENVGYYIRAMMRSNCIMEEWPMYFMAFGNSEVIFIWFDMDRQRVYEIKLWDDAFGDNYSKMKNWRNNGDKENISIYKNTTMLMDITDKVNNWESI